MTDRLKYLLLEIADLTNPDEPTDIVKLNELTTELQELTIDRIKVRVEAKDLHFGDADRVGHMYTTPEKDCLISDSGFSVYYAGFDYVDSSAITKVGRYTIWSPDDSRVAEHLSGINERFQEPEGDDE